LQNFKLYKNYKSEFEGLRAKLGKDPHFALLWHGTSRNDPKQIYDGEVGFNLNFSSVDSLWGIAVYFAQNAKYSDDYSFKCNDGDR
jgi:hypothetical protein